MKSQKLRRCTAAMFVCWLCVPSSSVSGRTIVEEVRPEDRDLIQRIANDTAYWGVEIYNSKGTADVTYNVSKNGKADPPRSETITHYGNIDGKNAYFRNDVDRKAGNVFYYITTPKGSLSGIARGDKTALTSMLPYGRVEGFIDAFVKISVFPVRQLLTNGDFAASAVKVTKLTLGVRDITRIEATLRFKKDPQVFDLLLEFTDFGRFVMTRYAFSNPSFSFTGDLTYSEDSDNPTPQHADITSHKGEVIGKKSIRVASYERGPVDLKEFDAASIGIEFSTPTRPKLYWIGLISFGIISLLGALLWLNRTSNGEKQTPETSPGASS